MRRAVLTAVVALSFTAVLAGCAALPMAEASREAAASAPGAPLVEEAIVTNVVDGDTIDVRFADGAEERIRLYAVDTPETHGGTEPFGPEASGFVEREVDGMTVWIETGVVLRDRYDRLLAYVWLERPGSRADAEVREKMLNAKLLEEGYAEVYRDSQDRTYMELLYELERVARDAGRGRWGVSSGG